MQDNSNPYQAYFDNARTNNENYAHQEMMAKQERDRQLQEEAQLKKDEPLDPESRQIMMQDWDKFMERRRAEQEERERLYRRHPELLRAQEAEYRRFSNRLWCAAIDAFEYFWIFVQVCWAIMVVGTFLGLIFLILVYLFIHGPEMIQPFLK